jgi:beta-barrel assembly-enhancing protease
LPARPEYIVDTSEFEGVKSRLASIENRHKVQNDNGKDHPTLRRATADNPTNGSGSGSGSQSGSSSGSGDDDRPTLKRSDGSQSLQ